MLNFYKIVKENLSFNRFEFRETVCLEYTCPIDAEQIGIFSRNDYIVHVLSGKKTCKTVDGEWTAEAGQTLYLKKGAEIIQQLSKESPGKWLVNRRVRHAANMIVNSELSISQVAFETGFEDLSHFSRVFRKITGINPSEYKKSVVFQ